MTGSRKKDKPGTMAHASIYSGDRDQEDHSMRPVRAKNFTRPLSKNKPGQVCSVSGAESWFQAGLGKK
jgi:hypothetical protein